MTYAAQVRCVTKTIPSPEVEDFYDFNSMLIICKYFIGSVVTIRTVDETIVEGILITIFNNKICLDLATVTKQSQPDLIVEMALNKVLNLNDVLLISTSQNCESDTSVPFEVTVQGKYIRLLSNGDSNGGPRAKKNIGDSPASRCLPGSKSIIHKSTNKITNVPESVAAVVKENKDYNHQGQQRRQRQSPAIETRINNQLKPNDASLISCSPSFSSGPLATGNVLSPQPLLNTMQKTVSSKKNVEKKDKEKEVLHHNGNEGDSSGTASAEVAAVITTPSLSSGDSVEKGSRENEKKTFTFNPNAPEFKPRSLTTVSMAMSSSDLGTVAGSGGNIGAYHAPLYSPLHQHHHGNNSQAPPPPFSSPVFPGNGAPAIFVPNIFFFSPPPPSSLSTTVRGSPSSAGPCLSSSMMVVDGQRDQMTCTNTVVTVGNGTIVSMMKDDDHDNVVEKEELEFEDGCGEKDQLEKRNNFNGGNQSNDNDSNQKKKSKAPKTVADISESIIEPISTLFISGGPQMAVHSAPSPSSTSSLAATVPTPLPPFGAPTMVPIFPPPPLPIFVPNPQPHQQSHSTAMKFGTTTLPFNTAGYGTVCSIGGSGGNHSNFVGSNIGVHSGVAVGPHHHSALSSYNFDDLTTTDAIGRGYCHGDGYGDENHSNNCGNGTTDCQMIAADGRVMKTVVLGGGGGGPIPQFIDPTSPVLVMVGPGPLSSSSSTNHPYPLFQRQRRDHRSPHENISGPGQERVRREQDNNDIATELSNPLNWPPLPQSTATASATVVNGDENGTILGNSRANGNSRNKSAAAGTTTTATSP